MTACLRTDNDNDRETYMFHWEYANRQWTLLCFSVKDEEYAPSDLSWIIDCTHETLEVSDSGKIVHEAGYILWKKLMVKWFDEPGDELEFVTFGELISFHRRSL